MDIAQKFGIPLQILHTRNLTTRPTPPIRITAAISANTNSSPNLAPLARDRNFAVIAYGENTSDIGDFRPGAQAAGEFQVRAPLKEAGLTKSEIRALSAQLGLPTADKPQMACLSSRLPYGETVTPEKLRMIEEAEYVLRDLGFYDVRVRHHELTAAGRPSSLARIEVGVEEMPKLLADGVPWPRWGRRCAKLATRT